MHNEDTNVYLAIENFEWISENGKNDKKNKVRLRQIVIVMKNVNICFVTYLP